MTERVEPLVRTSGGFTARSVHDGVGESVWPEGIHRIAPVYHWRTNEQSIRLGIDALLRRGTIPCGICNKPLRTSLEVQVDHDHETRLVRGYLCRDCNLGLGYFRDSPDMLARAAMYLMADHEDLISAVVDEVGE